MKLCVQFFGGGGLFFNRCAGWLFIEVRFLLGFDTLRFLLITDRLQTVFFGRISSLPSICAWTFDPEMALCFPEWLFWSFNAFEFVVLLAFEHIKSNCPVLSQHILFHQAQEFHIMESIKAGGGTLLGRCWAIWKQSILPSWNPATWKATLRVWTPEAEVWIYADG